MKDYMLFCTCLELIWLVSSWLEGAGSSRGLEGQNGLTFYQVSHGRTIHVIGGAD